jgi:dihydrofolate reductase
MGKVVFNMTVSLDGFVDGPNDNPDNGLGDGGEALFNWYFRGDTEISVGSGSPMLKVSAQSAEILKEAMEKYGAGIWGRKTFDIARAWGGHPPGKVARAWSGHPPGSSAFIVTHNAPQEWVYEGSPFTFVTDGVESAIRQAKQAAGDKDVVVCTASILQQCLNLGLMDEIHLDVAPLLLGNGVRLFDHLSIEPIALERIRVVAAPGVTHLAYRVVN